MSGSTALVLMGGGARAAYQIGVLDAVRQVLVEAGWPAARMPFDVLCGTSAGAINAAALATACDHFGESVDRLVQVWSGFRAAQVYRVDARGAYGNAAHWLGALTLGWLVRTAPRSLFDNTPLQGLLERLMDFERMRAAMAEGRLRALAITASSYTSGQHVTYYESREPVEPWSRTQRLACAARIGLPHLLASSAIPFVFPAVPLQLGDRQEFFGDGSMRQIAPVGPAIHLGAQRVMVVGVGQLERGSVAASGAGPQFAPPTLAQVAGHAMAGIFLDALSSDLERLRRVNATVELIPEAQRARSALRRVDVLVVSPSRRLDELAVPHLGELPRTVRRLMRMLGATDRRGAALASYLLFERGYVCRLIELGQQDALAQRGEILHFFGAPPAA